MNSVFVAALRDNDMTVLADLPRGLLTGDELPVFDWILSYRDRYGTLPTNARADKQFPFFHSSYFTSSDPARDELDQFIEERQKEKLATRLVELSEGVRAGEVAGPDAVVELSTYTQSPEASLVDMAEFDVNWFMDEGEALPFGVSVFDSITGGIHPGEYAVLAGRPGVGKSYIACWMALQWWQLGSRVLFISKEMPPKDVFARIVSFVAGINPFVFRNKETLADPRTSKRIEVALHMIRSEPRGRIVIPRKRISTVGDIRAFAQTGEYDAIVVDGIYLLGSPSKGTSKWERVSDVSNEMKQLATSEGVRVLAVTQLKRGGDKKGVDTEDLAFSDSLGQDADVVFGVTQGEDDGEVEMRLSKNRHGIGPKKAVEIGAVLSIDFDRMKIVEGPLDDDDD